MPRRRKTEAVRSDADGFVVQAVCRSVCVRCTWAGGTVADTVVLRRGIKKAATGAASGFASGRGLECVHVQLEGALQVCGLVLVHDIVLGELVQHGGYLGKQGFGGTLLRGLRSAFTALRAVLWYRRLWARLAAVWRMRFFDDLWFAIILCFLFFTFSVAKSVPAVAVCG